MSGAVIPAELRAFVRDRAGRVCEYCQSSEWVSGHYFEVDHIAPQSKGGKTVTDNLALACRNCNANKRDNTHGNDPETGVLVALFNPRMQAWDEHFSWSPDGTTILPLTSTGRVTVELLKMNDPLIMGARVIWVAAQVHPPTK